MNLDGDQVRAFRSWRGHLSGPGATDGSAAARAAVGIQAQIEGPAWWALSLRTAARPTAAAIKARVLDARTLVRTWAQRDTLHLFGVADWPWFAAADRLWSQTGRSTVRAPDDVLAVARDRLRAQACTRSDLADLVTEPMREQMALRVGEEQAVRYAAGRIPWQLAHLGEVCLGPKRKSEQSYVHRETWLTDPPAFDRDPAEAALELTRRYLGTYGPASAQDVAHFFGARVPLARAWIEALADECTPVHCDGRDLVARTIDLEALRQPYDAASPRLLAAYDSVLMAHADKRWTTPDEAERKAVWKRSAVVAATVMADGRIVATWTHKVRASGVTITVTPLSGWRPEFSSALQPDADRLAAHLERPAATIAFE